MFRILFIIIFFIAPTLYVCSSVWAESYPWSNGFYIYRGENRPIRGVLEDFAHQFSLKLSLSIYVNGTFDGVSRSQSPTQFLNDMANIHGFDWFYYDGILHVTANTERVTRIVSVRKSSMRGIRSTLQNVGLLNNRFGWNEVPDQDVVVITGPKVYLDIVESLVGRFNVAPKDIEIAVIRLRYSTAGDLALPAENGRVVIPGLVNTLNRLLRNGGIAQDASIKSKITDQEVAALGSQNMRDLVTIQGDERLNAVIIRAPKYLIGLYKSLVEKLDVPTELVEIDVAVIDVTVGAKSDLGIRWTAGSEKFNVGYGMGPQYQDGAGHQGNGAAALNLIDLPFGSTSLAFNTGYFLSRLKLLEENGNAQTVSRPSMLMMDNTMAVYNSQRTFHILNSSVQSTSTRPVSAGLSLTVRPRIIRDHNGLYVQMWLDIQDGGFDERSQGIRGYPVVHNHTVNTVLMLGEGESTLIAGDQYEYQTKSDAGIPILKDIPILGWFFSDHGSETTRRQRFFLLTPRVISTSELITGGKGKPLSVPSSSLPENLQTMGLEKAVQAADPDWKAPPPPAPAQPQEPERQAYLPDEDKVLPIYPAKQASYGGQLVPPSPNKLRRSSSPTALTRGDGALL